MEGREGRENGRNHTNESGYGHQQMSPQVIPLERTSWVLPEEASVQDLYWPVMLYLNWELKLKNTIHSIWSQITKDKNATVLLKCIPVICDKSRCGTVAVQLHITGHSIRTTWRDICMNTLKQGMQFNQNLLTLTLWNSKQSVKHIWIVTLT